MGKGEPSNLPQLVVETIPNPFVDAETITLQSSFRACDNFCMEINRTVSCTLYGKIWKLWLKYLEDQHELAMVYEFVKLLHAYPSLVMKMNCFITKCVIYREPIGDNIEYIILHQNRRILVPLDGGDPRYV